MPRNLLRELDSPDLDLYELLNLMGLHYRLDCSAEDKSVIYPSKSLYCWKVRSKNERIGAIERGRRPGRRDAGRGREGSEGE